MYMIKLMDLLLEGDTFNAEKYKQMGGYVGQSNKASAQGLYELLNFIGIPITLDKIKKADLIDLLSNKENKLKLYNLPGCLHMELNFCP